MLRKELKTLLATLVSGSKSIALDDIQDLTQLASDVSSKTHYRLKLRSSLSSAVLVVFQEVEQTIKIAGREWSRFELFYSLSEFFTRHGLPVPEIYAASKASRALLTQDAGNVSLRALLSGEMKREDLEIFSYLDRKEVFKEALRITDALQKIVPDPSCPAFFRVQGEDDLLQAAKLFMKYVAERKLSRASELDAVKEGCSWLSKRLAQHPQALVHYDFGAHNIFVKPDAKLLVLDYQDAQIAPYLRDLAALIHDRGVDELLGESACHDLLKLSWELRAKPDDFLLHYRETLFHWLIRTIALFSKLSEVQGREQYKEYLPAAFRTLARCCLDLQESHTRIADFTEIMAKASPYFREGLGDPWIHKFS